MQSLLDRFIRYAKINTRSSEEITDRTPTTDNQWDLARLLEKELTAMGMKEVALNKDCFLTATLPANTEKKIPVIGFLAHLDTSGDFSADNVQPQIIEKYDGKEIKFKGNSGIVLSPVEFPDLLLYQGQTLITTDGTTLLGADDKAGIAAIMEAMQYLIDHPEIDHGKVRVAFTPDEETGMGITHFDVDRFAADFAYTMDGGQVGEIEYENFNACRATVSVQGKSVHPGSAKNIMKNAILIFQEFNGMLPPEQRPEHTEGREGFYHLMKTYEGSVESFTAKYIVRDHDPEKFDQRKALMLSCADLINQKYGESTIEVELVDQYRNMVEVIEPVMHIVDTAKEAMLTLGIEPINNPIRGGTDGAQLSYRGLPTPNIFNGGHNYHGPYEYVCLESMEKSMQVIVKIIELYANK